MGEGEVMKRVQGSRLVAKMSCSRALTRLLFGKPAMNGQSGSRRGKMMGIGK